MYDFSFYQACMGQTQLVLCGCGECEGRGWVLLFSCVWCGEWTVHCSVHFPLGPWTVNFPRKFCLFRAIVFFCLGDGGGEGQSKEFPSFLHVPQRVPNSTSLLSHMLWQMFSSFHLSRWAKGEELHTLKQNLLIWIAFIVSFLFLSDGPIKLAHCEN
jgi:hypothetical protein